ncbi:hypothetical protein N9754_01605 [Flavobacteriaceae bacterium]|nr:hypothetical protein [Flavobacteriaceae bacterium]
MKQKIIIVDLIGPTGHINWLNKLFSIIKNEFDIVFISYKSYCKHLLVENKITLSDKLLPTNSRVINLIKSFKALSKVKKIVRDYDKDIPVYIVGFENISYAIFGFKRRKTLLHLHNNLSLSNLSLFFLKITTINNSFVVFEKFMKTFLKDFNNSTYVLNHTLNFPPKDKNVSDDDFIFISSKVDDLIFIDPIIKFAEAKRLKIIFRSELKIDNSQTLISMPFFDNYKELLMNSKYVVIISPHDYRVGGVFYEAMLFNKKIILLGSKGLFINEMNKRYPYSFVQIQKNLYINLDVNKKNNDYSNFLLEHNDSAIINQFQEMINKIK